jgi:RNA polymerase sigma-70 factor (ECF subfamily)
VFEQERDTVWRAAYAITGAAQDADDIVQDTFLLPLNAKPWTDPSLRPWLRTVAANLSRDRPRQRKRRAYRGPWLPSPVGIGPVPSGARSPRADIPELPDARILRTQSVHFAWLLALEALTATQRTVLVLRDVLGCSTQETATPYTSPSR